MGPNEFLRTRPPLNITQTYCWLPEPSLRVVIWMSWVSRGMVATFAFLYAATFAGIVVPPVWVVPVIVAGYGALAAADGSYPVDRGSWWWRRQWPWLEGVPRWVAAVSIVTMLLCVGQLAWTIVGADGGVAEVIDGRNVIADHGRVLRELSEVDYGKQLASLSRLTLMWGGAAWVNAGLFWWVWRERLRVRETRV